MHFEVENLIYIYLFICIALSVFNILYIFSSGQRDKRREKAQKRWLEQLEKQLRKKEKKEDVEIQHRQLIAKRLRRVEELGAYSAALEQLREKEPALAEAYAQEVWESWQEAASAYLKRDAMERAYLAWFLAENIPCSREEYRPVMEILQSFLEDSTVYCRENVLKAFYRLGNSRAMENTLQIFQEEGWFHHQKLLADGLVTFQGDKEELAGRLWQHYGSWNVTIMLAVISFITSFSGQYREEFLRCLQDEGTDLEIRLAMLRYFRKHVHEPVREVLFRCLENKKEDSVRIVAASVLIRYPGGGTEERLKEALHDRNWYVRYNAAMSLVKLGADQSIFSDILEGSDKYAREILVYMLEKEKTGETA